MTIVKSRSQLSVKKCLLNGMQYILLTEEQRGKVEERENHWRDGLQKKDEAQQNFILDPRNGLYARYREVLLKNESYFLDTTEIGLAARLFNKNVQLFSGDPIQIFDNLNEGENRELVVIHQGRNHFSRCIPIQ